MANRARGFTLLEVLLAFVIFAVGVAVVLQIIASSSRATVRARVDTEVALLAQSVMEAVGTDYPLESGTWDGTALDEYEWTLNITEMDVSAMSDAPQLAELIGTQFFRVDLDVRWDNGRDLREEHFATVRSRLQAP